MDKRKLAVLSSVVIALTSGVAASSVAAQSEDKPYHYVRVWYSDPARTQATGQETFYCDSTVERTGSEGPYERYYNGFCQ